MPAERGLGSIAFSLGGPAFDWAALGHQLTKGGTETANGWPGLGLDPTEAVLKHLTVIGACVDESTSIIWCARMHPHPPEFIHARMHPLTSCPRPSLSISLPSLPPSIPEILAVVDCVCNLES